MLEQDRERLKKRSPSSRSALTSVHLSQLDHTQVSIPDSQTSLQGQMFTLLVLGLLCRASLHTFFLSSPASASDQAVRLHFSGWMKDA